MLFCVILLLLTIGASANQAPQIDCSILQIAACAFLVDADKVNKDGFAETDEILDTRCKQSQPILKCFNDFASNCPGGDLQHLKQFFIDEYATYSRVCEKNTDLRKMYLKHAKCLNKYKQDMQRQCGNLFQFEEFEKLTDELCTEYATRFQCAFKDIASSCGKEALELEKEILIPSTTLMDNICRELKYSGLKNFPRAINNIKFSNSIY